MRCGAIKLFTSKISDAVIEGRHAYERSQIADQKAATDAAESGEKVDYVDTSKYESYEKQEGDFIEPGAEPEPVLEPIAEPETRARKFSKKSRRRVDSTHRPRDGRAVGGHCAQLVKIADEGMNRAIDEIHPTRSIFRHNW